MSSAEKNNWLLKASVECWAGTNGEQYGILLVLTHDLHESRQLNNQNKNATIVWFDSEEERDENIRRVAGVSKAPGAG